MTSGENTELTYVFEDGYSVEMHSAKREVRRFKQGDIKVEAEFYVATYALVNNNDEEIFEGILAVRPDLFHEPPSFFQALCGVIYALKQDYHRAMYPHKFDATDQPIKIAHDERVCLWLRVSDVKMFDLALEEIAGTTRTGRRYYIDGVFERAEQRG